MSTKRHNSVGEIFAAGAASNALFERVPDVLRAKLNFRRAALKAGEEINPSRMIIFPISCLLSSAALQEDGRLIGVRLVGRESAAPNFGQVSEFLSVVVGGDALLVEANETLLRELLGQLLLLSGQTWLDHAAIQMSCIAHHKARERLATWLWCAMRQGGGRPIEISQDALAQLLGVTRTSLVEVARPLRASGLIQYGRGVVRVSDVIGLKLYACHCAEAQLQCLGV